MAYNCNMTICAYGLTSKQKASEIYKVTIYERKRKLHNCWRPAFMDKAWKTRDVKSSAGN